MTVFDEIHKCLTGLIQLCLPVGNQHDVKAHILLKWKHFGFGKYGRASVFLTSQTACKGHIIPFSYHINIGEDIIRRKGDRAAPLGHQTGEGIFPLIVYSGGDIRILDKLCQRDGFQFCQRGRIADQTVIGILNQWIQIDLL